MDISSTSDKILRETFVRYNHQFRLSSSRIACMLVILLMPAGMLLDAFVYPEHSVKFAFLRLICSSLALGGWLLLRTKLGKRYYRLHGMFWFLLPSFFICLMIYATDGINSPYYAGLNLVLIGIAWVAQVDFVESFIAVILTIGMYCVACYMHGGLELSITFNNLYFIVLTGIIVVTGCYYLHRLRFREFALRQELDESRRSLEESHEKLVELDRAKTDFFANISHELRTPLTLLIGPLEKLKHGNSPSKSADDQELLDIMFNNAMRLLRLINDLLHLVKMDSGNLKLDLEEVELRPYLEGVARSVSSMARDRKLEFETLVQCKDRAVVSLDRDKVEKIILNLLFNAFKFTPSGGRVRFEASLRNGMLEIMIQDTGKGIAKEDLPNIFNRFWQVEGMATRKYQGVGIGLALVNELSALHGGEVRAESELGKGTTVRVTLNARMGYAIEPDEPSSSGESVQETEMQGWLTDLYRRAELFPAHVLETFEHGQPRAVRVESDIKVLVADDEPEMRRFLRSQLQSSYRVIEARNGAEAIQAAKQGGFSLILVDYMMPEIDGMGVVRAIREQEVNKTVPVIMLTARADEESKMSALKLGATDFLTKPFASSELTVRCRNLVASYQMQLLLEEKNQKLEDLLKVIKQTEIQLMQQGKMATLGQLSAGLMHEINNPLNFANTALHLLKKRMGKVQESGVSTLEKPLEDIHAGIKRVATIVGSLRSFTHPDTESFAEVRVRDMLETAARFVRITPSGIGLELEVDPDFTVWGNQNQLIQLYINLLQNSVDSLEEKGGEKKLIRLEAVVDGNFCCISIRDNGMGISRENQSKMFDAFYTTKDVGHGTGLGLNICQQIVRQHAGRIEVESVENEYCRIDVSVPVRKKEAVSV